MSGILPNWIAKFLGVEAGSGEGTAWSLDLRWTWAPWLTLVVLACVVLFVVAIYLRENRQARRSYRMFLAAMRLSLLAIVLIMISQLMLSLARTGLSCVAVLVDDSLSMGIVDRYDQRTEAGLAKRLGNLGLDRPSRLNLAKMVLLERGAALPAAIQRSHKLRLYWLTGLEASRAADLPRLVEELKSHEPVGQSTRLGAAVRGILDDLRDAPPAAVILLTDGINTDGPSLAEAAEAARRLGVPLDAAGLGDSRPVRDLEVSDLLVEEVAFAGDVLPFEFKLAGPGFAGRQVAVVLRERGKPDVLAKIDATVSPDGRPQSLQLLYRPTEAGEHHFVVEVQPLDGELRTDNNRQERSVEIRKEKIRVLLADGYPRFEFRYLRNMLARDGTIELHTILLEADPEYAEQDAAALRVFPVRCEELFQYDVVILGDLNPAMLSTVAMQDLADFVAQPGKGGGLVFIAGQRHMPLAYRDTPLAPLMPIRLDSVEVPPPGETSAEGFTIEPTQLGLANPAFQLGQTPVKTRTIWEHLPPVYWLLEAPEVKPGAQVLAVDPERLGSQGQHLPVILMQYVGAGRVWFHATDETWRWRYRMGDVLFARYWVQTIRFLSRSKLAERGGRAVLSTDRRQYQPGEPVELWVRFADPRLAPAEDDGVTVVVEHAGYATQRIPLRRNTAQRGLFAGRLETPAVGGYHAWLAIPAMQGEAPAVDFAVAAPPGEFQRVQMDAVGLAQAAKQTKGRFYTIQTAEQLAGQLPEGRQVPIEMLPPKPLWNAWPLLLVFLVLLVGEWILRKAGGMA